MTTNGTTPAPSLDSEPAAEWYNKTLKLWSQSDVDEKCSQFFVVGDNVSTDIEFVRWLMYTILFPTVAIIGIIGNFTNLILLRRFNGRSYVYLYWLAVSDLIIMLLDFLVVLRVLPAPGSRDWAYVLCNVTPAATGWLVATSSFIVLVVTIERFYAVCFPMECRLKRDARNPTLVSLFCLVLGFITFYPSTYILMTQTVGLQTENSFTPLCYVCRYVKVNRFLDRYYKIRGTLTRTIPTIVVAVLNSWMIIALRQHQRTRSSALNQTPGPKEQAEGRIKLIIGSMTTIFVLCYIPTCVKDIFIPPNGKTTLCYETFRLSALLLLHVNTACNFVVYCTCSPAIRDELRKLFCNIHRLRSNERKEHCSSDSRSIRRQTGLISIGKSAADASKQQEKVQSNLKTQI